MKQHDTDLGHTIEILQVLQERYPESFNYSLSYITPMTWDLAAVSIIIDGESRYQLFFDAETEELQR